MRRLAWVALLGSSAALAEDTAADPSSDEPAGEPVGDPVGEPVGDPVGEPVGESIVVLAEDDALDEAPEVSAEDIVRWGVATPAEALERAVTTTAATGMRGERMITVRGFDQRQLAVFIDGVPASVPYEGQLDLGKLSAAGIGAMDVVAGGAPGLLGPGGLGGAVQIRSRRAPATPQALARVGGAAHGALRASAWAGGPAGPLRIAVGGGGEASPGFPLSGRFQPVEREDGGLRDASDRRSADLSLGAELDLPGGGGLRSSVRLTQGDYGVPSSLVADRPRYWRFSEFRDLSASVQHHGPAGARVRVDDSVFFAANTNVLDSYDDATRTTQDSTDGWHSTYRDHREGGALRVRGRLGHGGPTLGAWSLLDHEVHSAVSDEGDAEDRVDTTRLSGGLSLRRDAPLGAFLGVEADAELPGASSGLSLPPPFVGPSAGLSLRGAHSSLALGLARRTRFPTLKERFSWALGAREPNLDLGPESAWHLSLDGSATPWRGVALRASVYDAEVTDLIEEVPTGDGDAQMQNTGGARLLGADATLALDRQGWLRSELSAGWLRATHSDGDAIAYRPAWQLAWQETLRPSARVELWGSARLVGSQRYQDPDTLEWGTLGTYGVIDAAVRYAPTPDLDLRLRGSNLADSLYQTRVGYPDPGRTLWLEVELRG